MAGAYLSLAAERRVQPSDMTAGRGYIALAAIIFGRKWRPKNILPSAPAWLFGLPGRHRDPPARA
jgi:ABC-type uncharacterized transport system permease subunit